MHTLVHGTTFLVLDGHGEIGSGTEGLYVDDRRVVSRWELRVGGERPLPLSSPACDHGWRRFAARATDVFVNHEWLVADHAAHWMVTVTNLGNDARSVPVEVALDADFRDVFEVKEHAFGAVGEGTGTLDLGTTDTVPAMADIVADSTPLRGMSVAVRSSVERGMRTLLSTPSALGDDGRTVRWTLELPARGSVALECVLTPAPIGVDPLPPTRSFSEARTEHDSARAGWHDTAPRIAGVDPGIIAAWDTSIDDLGALAVRTPSGLVPAAGAPWFMAVFGRDSLITCLQTLPLGPARARATLRHLAACQATDTDPEIDAEPGKIVHELRAPVMAKRWHAAYYGSIDATPLFVVLLDELHRWHGDDAIVHELEEAARAALSWVRTGGPRVDDFLAYDRRATTGLDNQSWKDSHDSQRFHDGTLATGPIAPLEAQGYAVDAMRRGARLAREVWGDDFYADMLLDNANSLAARIERRFWIGPDEVRARTDEARALGARHRDPREGGYYALALDGSGTPVDSLTSNIGHLVWSGLASSDRAAQTARQLAHPVLASGWGVRTMSTLDAGYDPLSYHCGTVWPHDTSLCVAGMVSAGEAELAAQVGRDLLDAAARAGGRLPEVLSGIARADTGGLVPYPTTCSPQAWAAGAPILVLSALLGLRPDVAIDALVADADEVPAWLEGLHLRGVYARGRRWDVRVDRGSIRVSETDRATSDARH